MGLDQYVGLKKHISTWKKKYNESIMTEAIKNALGVDLEVDAIQFELQYFRKANHIHGWFEEHAPEGWEGEQFHVDIEDINKLKEICEEVLKDHDKAPVLLPCTSGFFFGDQDYDSYYFDSVQKMLDAINKVFKLEDKDEYTFTYSASW